ncbi:hypothetical protein HDV05_006630, partial [Chytridiales sp. JEL 0842]
MVSSFLSTALIAGEAAMMVSSVRNLHNVQLLLENAGINVEWAMSSGQLTMVDGYSHLSDIMDLGTISQEAFDNLFSHTVNDLLIRYPRLCFYGDIVSGMVYHSLQPNSSPVLGNLAIEIETMFHKFQEDKPRFISLCGYWMESFTSNNPKMEAAVAEKFRQVCHYHDHGGTEEVPVWDSESKSLSTEGLAATYKAPSKNCGTRKEQEILASEVYLKAECAKKAAEADGVPQTPTSSITAAPTHRHLVQFYTSEEFLCQMVSSFLSTALVAGEAAMMVSSVRNLHNVQVLLERAGINVAWAMSTGQLTMVDGYSHLSGIMDLGTLTQEAFDNLFSVAVNDLLAKYPRLCFYGDLVSGMVYHSLQPQSSPLLGNLAIEIEIMFHKFQEDKPRFISLCGYWMESFISGDSEMEGKVVEKLRKLCEWHDHAGTEDAPVWDCEKRLLSAEGLGKHASKHASDCRKQEMLEVEAYVQAETLKRNESKLEEFLYQMVSSFLSTALVAGEAAMMVSSVRNLHNVQLLLETAGINVSWAMSSGQLTMVDGYSHLSKFMALGTLTQEAFDSLFTVTVNDLLARYPRLCFYGDLVSGMVYHSLQPNSTPLLGDLAIQAETFFHKMQEDKPRFISLCGYWMESFSLGDSELNVAVAQKLKEICQWHDHAGTEEVPVWDAEKKLLSREGLATISNAAGVEDRKPVEQIVLEEVEATRKKQIAKPILSRLQSSDKEASKSTANSGPIIQIGMERTTSGTGNIQKGITSLSDPGRLIDVLAQRAEILQRQLTALQLKEATFTDAMSILARSASESLKRERDVHNQILSVLPVGVLCAESWREEQMYVNKTFCEMVGCSEADVMSGKWLEVIHPQDRPKVQELLIFMETACHEVTEPVKLEYRIQSQKVSEFGPSSAESASEVDVNLQQYRPEEENLVWIASETLKSNIQGRCVFVHAIVDTTELKRINAEKTLISAREAYQMHKAIDADKRRLLLDEFIDSLCHELRNPLNGIVGNLDIIQTSLETRKKLIKNVMKRHRVSTTTIADDDETITITKKEIRALYNQIEDEEASISTVTTCANHSRILADDVLALSKLESNKLSLHNSSFCPKSLLGEVANIMGPKASAKGLDVRFNMPFNITPFVADPFRIRQVIINLFSNAIVYTEKGSITLGLEYLKLSGPPSDPSIKSTSSQHSHTTTEDAQESYLRISITDTGVGMTPDERQQLFQKFSQPTAAVSREQQYGGTGLGLVISKKLVELMGGWIEIESVKGVGSKFSFTIKAGDLDAEIAGAEKGIGEVSTSPKRTSDGLVAVKAVDTPSDLREGPNGLQNVPVKSVQSILIVEDNPVNQKVMERFLKQCKKKFTTVNNGLEAVELMKSSPDHGIDLVFMDINMPVMD